REGGLGDIGELLGIAHRKRRHILDRGDEMDRAGNAAHRALDLGMAGMTDQDHVLALGGVALAFAMHLGDQRAGRVDHRQVAFLGALLDGARHAMGAEDGDAARRHLVDLLDEAGALGAQALDDMPVVDDLMADIDGWAVFLEGPLDDLDRPLDPGTKSPRLRQNNLHSNSRSAVSGGSSPPGTGPDYTRN